MAKHESWRTTKKAYMGSWSLIDGKDMIVQIKDVTEAPVYSLFKHEESQEIILHFEGDLKPMVASRETCVTIEKVLGTDVMDQWVGKKIQLCLAPSAKSETGFKLAVRPFAPEGRETK